MRRSAVVLVCSLAALLVIGGALMQSLLVMQRIAAVSDAHGDVQLRQKGENAFVPLGDREHVMAGDMVRTGPDGSVTLSWVDGNRIQVRGNSTLQVLKCQVNPARQSETYLFRLDIGRIWVRVLKAVTQQSKFEVSTPTVTAAVRGTVFSVTVEADGATQVAVLKGQVDLNDGKTALPVRERQMAVMGPNGPGAVLELGLDEESEWRKVEQVAKPALRVDEPSAETVPGDATAITVSGKAERGAKLTVNGSPVETKINGKFETTVPVPADADRVTITVKATDRKGYSSVIAKTLTK